MPDWSYQPLIRPLLFRLKPGPANQVTLSVIGTLARVWGGPQLIDLLGHMKASDSISRTTLGLSLCSPVGLGAGVDPSGDAIAAFERFGFGFIEVGPLLLGEQGVGAWLRERRIADGALIGDSAPQGRSLDMVQKSLQRYRSKQARAIAVAVRLAHDDATPPPEAANDAVAAIERLTPLADWIVLDTRWGPAATSLSEWERYLSAIALTLSDPTAPPIMISIAPDTPMENALELACMAQDILRVQGMVVAGGIKTSGDATREYGPASHSASLALVAALRQRLGSATVLIGSGGIADPSNALAFLDAGADLVQIHSGFVYSGPGLPKRINQAVAARTPTSGQQESVPIYRQGWFWMCLLGFGMILSGTLAWILGMTRVVLPYDERFIGLTRAQIGAVNPMLLCFMEHDRVTLAGTMVSIGVLYTGLAAFGMRSGEHWAWKAIVVSASLGFASFFLYLGFGYFDPLHALAACLLLPLFIAGCALGPSAATPRRLVGQSALKNDRAWRQAQYGQLLFVIVGIGLILAGITIAGVGVTHVFVPTDLQFLHTDPATLARANPHLLPVIAHDRAGFGGALASDGLAVLLTSLWGFRAGAKWVWWTILLAALPGYIAAFGVHLMIGYMNFYHLAPAGLALLLTAYGLALSRGFLCQPEDTLPCSATLAGSY